MTKFLPISEPRSGFFGKSRRFWQPRIGFNEQHRFKFFGQIGRFGYRDLGFLGNRDLGYLGNPDLGLKGKLGDLGNPNLGFLGKLGDLDTHILVILGKKGVIFCSKIRC